MARINPRPDIIYVKELTKEDKDNFEKILNKFKMTNNGEAVKKLFSEFLKNEVIRSEQFQEIKDLQNQLQEAKKEKDGVTTFGWTQKLSPHALSLRDEKQEKELQFRV
jgi:hypothetical protein